MWGHVDWVGSRDGTKRLQSSRNSRAAGSLSSASLLMLPAPRTTPPRTPPLGPAPWMLDSFASPPTAQHSAQRALLGRYSHPHPDASGSSPSGSRTLTLWAFLPVPNSKESSASLQVPHP